MPDLIGNKKLLIVLILSLLIRIAIPLGSWIIYQDASVFYGDDSKTYIQPAREMLEKGSFTSNGKPEIFRTPGYSILLFAGILLQQIEFITIIIQIIIGCLTVYLIFKLVESIFENRKAALVSALLYAVEPLAIVFCGLLLSETLFTFVIVLFAYFLCQFLKKGSLASCIASGILIAVSTYIRPVSLYLPIIVFIALVFLRILKKVNVSVPKLILLVALPLTLDSLWIVRNGVKSGYFGFASVQDVNVYPYQAAAILSIRENKPYYEMIEILRKRADEYQKDNNLNDSQILGYVKKEGTRIVLENPLTFAVVHMKGVLRAASTPGGIEFLKILKLYPHRGGLMGEIVDKGVFAVLGQLIVENPLLFWTQAILFLQLLFYYFLFACHFFAKNRKMLAFSLLIFIVMIYFLFASGGPHAVDRFRHPIMPFICAFAGLGLLSFVRLIKRKKANKADDEKNIPQSG